MNTIILRVSIVILFFGVLSSCKKDEETFDLKNDLLTPLISFNTASIPDEHAVWRLDRARISKTSRDKASNFMEILLNDDFKFPANARPLYIGFAEENCKHSASFSTIGGSTSESIGTWQIINNDEIVLDSLAVFYNIPSSYFNVEMQTKTYNDSNQFTSLVGMNPKKLGDKWSVILTQAPTGKIDYLKLVIDKFYPNEDDSEEIHYYSELYFSRIIPKLGSKSIRKEYK